MFFEHKDRNKAYQNSYQVKTSTKPFQSGDLFVFQFWMSAILIGHMKIPWNQQLQVFIVSEKKI